nr:hypothetical protein Iba_chr08aCG10350 [Ipomoea batatas]
MVGISDHFKGWSEMLNVRDLDFSFAPLSTTPCSTPPSSPETISGDIYSVSGWISVTTLFPLLRWSQPCLRFSTSHPLTLSVPPLPRHFAHGIPTRDNTFP